MSYFLILLTQVYQGIYTEFAKNGFLGRLTVYIKFTFCDTFQNDCKKTKNFCNILGLNAFKYILRGQNRVFLTLKWKVPVNI